jgi:hypothetical protein
LFLLPMAMWSFRNQHKLSFNQSMFLIDWLFNLRNLTARGHYYLV